MNTSPEQIRHQLECIKNQGLILPYGEDFAPLHSHLELYGKEIENRIGILPLEGFDSSLDGSPTDMVYRRYLRFVKGGAGLIWFEACAVSEDGKSNPYQMSLTDENVNQFKDLIASMDKTSYKLKHKKTFKIIQLTHSGRVSKDKNWNPIPLAAKLDDDEYKNSSLRYATDEDIQQIVKNHIHAALLAKEAGFDAVDIKVCHGYFLCELLSAFHRPGIYGGSFENRTRALFEIIDGINALNLDHFGITVRLNAFDGAPVPYGYGITKEDGRLKADLSEATKICKMLAERGVELINISASSPSQHLFGPDPTDQKYQRYVSSADLLTAVKILKENVPDVKFMCSGLSAFHELGSYIAAGGIAEGWFDIAGFGRQALAYPDFANDILQGDGLRSDLCCAGCNSCYKLMDPGHTMTGCIVKDTEVYMPLYKEHVLKHPI